MVAPLIAVIAGLMVLTGAIHSLLGEARLIAPLLRSRQGVLASDQARFLLRLTWHGFSALLLILALILPALVWWPDAVFQVALGAVGATFLIFGLVDIVATRGRHIGWPFLTAIGVLALTALAVARAG